MCAFKFQSQVETSMVSVERIQEYQDDLDQEAPYLIPEQDPDKSWPEYGEVMMMINFVSFYYLGGER